MRLSRKLLGWLNRAFDKDPHAFLALRLRYGGDSMQWQVADGVLTTTVSGGIGTALSVDLSQYTIGTLAGWLELQPGYSVPYRVGADLAGVAALRLVEGSGDQDASNGDHLTGYTSILHAYVDTMAVELAAAQTAIEALPDELAVTTADGGWLDYQGSYYAVPRLDGETDPVYSRRIIAEVLRPLGNNVALEAAIAAYTGQTVTVSDVVVYPAPEPRFSGLSHFNGAYHFQPAVHPVYGLFDVLVGYDVLGADVPTAFIARLRTIIDRLRDAGTQLRAVALSGTTLADDGLFPTDGTDTLIISHRRRFDGTFNWNGAYTFGGDVRDTGTLAGVTSSATLSQAPLPVTVNAGGAAVGVDVPDQQGNPIPLEVLWDSTTVS